MTDTQLSFRVRIVGGCQPDELMRLHSQIRGRQSQWAIADDGDANVMIYNLDREAGQVAWSQHDSEDTEVAHIAFATGTAPEDARFAINRSSHAFQLTALFDEVERVLKSKTPTIDPNFPLLKTLRSTSGKEPLAISTGGAPQIIVCPAKGTGYSVDWPVLSELAQSPAEAIQLNRLTSEDVETMAQEAGLVPRELRELVWFAALEGSSGQLLGNPDMDQPVRLRRMPDFGRLYHRPTHVRVAVMMTYHSLRISEIARRASASLPEVISLYNACSCLDLIAEAEKSAPAKKFRKVSAAKAGLFRSILARLSQPGEAVG